MTKPSQSKLPNKSLCIAAVTSSAFTLIVSLYGAYLESNNEECANDDGIIPNILNTAIVTCVASAALSTLALRSLWDIHHSSPTQEPELIGNMATEHNNLIEL